MPAGTRKPQRKVHHGHEFYSVQRRERWSGGPPHFEADGGRRPDPRPPPRASRQPSGMRRYSEADLAELQRLAVDSGFGLPSQRRTMSFPLSVAATKPAE